MTLRGLITVSIGANLVLAGVVIHLAKSRFTVPPEKISVVTKTVTNVSQQMSEQTPPVVTNVSPLAEFHWRQIESADYPIYVANLRNVHCPEKTIRNILIPDIEELYDKRRREELQPAATNFWVGGRARVALNRERVRKAIALDDEESALVKQLLGIDWVRPGNSRGDFFNRFEMIALPYLLTRSLPIEKAKEIFTVGEKYERLQRIMREETGGILLPSDEAKAKELKGRFKAELAQLMSADEFEEFSLRMGMIGGFDKIERGLKDSSLALSPGELREIARLNSVGHDLFSHFNFGSSDEDAEPTPQQIKETEQAIKSLLGDARYEMYQEAADDDFRNAKQFVQKERLPTTTSRALFEIQKAAEDRAGEILADKTLSAADRKRALEEVRTTTEDALAQTVGVKLVEKYRQNNGDWLDGISKKRK